MINPSKERVYTAGDIYQTLKNEILTLKLVPGATISETEMAQRFRLSRTPVRAAFGKLLGEDLIKVVPQKGTYITLLDFDYILQLLYMREKVEHHVIKEAAEKQTPTFLQELTQNLKKQKEVVSSQQEIDQVAFFRLDRQFHCACYALTDKERLWDRIDQIDHQYIRYRILYYSIPKSFQILYREHCKMYKIIAEKRLDLAEGFCRAHLFGHVADANSFILEHYSSYFYPQENQRGSALN